MLRNIPGFYYDAAKKKYFKVQPNHAGPGQQHSRQVIREKENATKKRKLTDYHLVRQQQQTATRSALLAEPLLGRLTLRKQLGQGSRGAFPPASCEDVAAYYACSLSRNESQIVDSPSNIGGLVVDEATGAILYAEARAGNGSTLHYLHPSGVGSYPEAAHVFEAMPDSFVDMAVSRQFRKLLYASSGPRGTQAVLLDVPRAIDDPHVSTANQMWAFGDETAWQIAVSRDTGASFALATTHAIRVFKMLPEHISCTAWTIQDSNPVDYTATAFGRDQRTVMGGTRSGVIKFFDERTQGSVQRVKHTEGVSAMRMIDDVRVIIRGLLKMSLYDLRYTRQASKKSSKKSSTRPYRLFPWESKSESFRVGFDYNPELAILATGATSTGFTTEVNEEMQLFSVRTGRKIGSRIVATNDRHGSPVSCIQFSRGVRSELRPGSELRVRENEPPSLLTSEQGRIIEWKVDLENEDESVNEEE